jgi:hypothetical protein
VLVDPASSSASRMTEVAPVRRIMSREGFGSVDDHWCNQGPEFPVIASAGGRGAGV